MGNGCITSVRAIMRVLPMCGAAVGVRGLAVERLITTDIATVYSMGVLA